MPEVPTDQPTTNAAEIRRWNDDRWTSRWPQREALTEATGDALAAALRATGIQPGWRALEIGSGSGRAAIEVAKLVGPGGSVVGVDISHALSATARQLATDAGVGNATFLVADAQTDAVPGGPFDLSFSRFGVMFFDEPSIAFTNILNHLKPGGHLTFVCWQSVERNPWHTGVVLKEFVPAPATPAPGKSAVGPFTLGEADRTTWILEAAGFESISHEERDLVVEAPAGAVFDSTQLDFYGVPADRQAAAAEVVDEHLARFHVAGDRYQFPLAFAVYQARKPG